MLSKDVDLARFEPNLFGTWFLQSQVVAKGTNGLVAGTQFVAAGTDFIESRVAAGNVIWLQSADSAIVGAYEITDVLDSTSLSVSVVRAGDRQELLPVGSASGLTWRIVSYDVQCYEAMRHISERFSLRPGCDESQYGIEDVTNPESLMRASVFATLAIIFDTLYCGQVGEEILFKKAELYTRKFQNAIERARVLIDTGNDGTAELQASGGEILLRRD